MSASTDWDDLFLEWGQDAEGQPLPLTVETHLGAGQLGNRYAAPVTIPGLPQMPQHRLVRTSGGNEIVSTTAVYVPLFHRDQFALHSKVVLADGRASTVVSLQTSDIDGLFGFVQVNLE